MKEIDVNVESLDSFECDQCGACCSTFIVCASQSDADEEPRIKSEGLEMPLWLQTETRKFKLTPLPFHEGCCFLGSDNLCTIYQSRPKICRQFSAGSPQCQEARAAKGLGELVAIGR